MVKEKPNSTRIYDNEGYRQRAACICVKDESESEILLVTSSSHTDQWIVPGGGIEPEETSDVAALREVIEEAGVQGRIERFLGTFQNEERKHRTAVYVLIVTEELPEWEDSKAIGRKRKWFTFEKAMEQLAADKPVQMDYLEHLRPHKKCNHQTDNGTAPT
ncbi:unnamed protein product [Orchesella dallaii]|uniref:diphosphoinositol-polyphosphate diphosphatase n=1 Tax=Orchesella dallaii TaxID=48710 RepID=A0ABP1QES7_9HEXA